MSSPQIEKGFLKIASGKPENDILTALIKANLTATQYQIMMVVIRKTWGFNKKEDWISISQFVELTSKSRKQIIEDIKKLVKYGLLVKSTTLGKTSLLKLNKCFNEWKSSLVKSTTLVKSTLHSSVVQPTKLVKSTTPTIDNTKDTITKDIPANKLQVSKKPSNNANLNEVVSFLEETLSTKIVNWGKQAKALSDMLKVGYTKEQIKKTITYMATKDDFFSEKGFDLTTVSNQISRYKAEEVKRHG